MPEEPKPESLTLSRFFEDNLDAVRSLNVVADFETSPYFQKCTKNTDAQELKKKKVKRKSLGPQCRGFSQNDQKLAEVTKINIGEAVTKSEDRLKEVDMFLGFTSEDINNSSILCDKSQKWTRPFEKTREDFHGFSIEDQRKSTSETSNVLDACASIRSNIYKKIDRRILTNHMREHNHSEAVVRSKYWWKNRSLLLKEEDKTWTRNNLLDNDLLLKKPRTGIKSENIGEQTDLGSLDMENVIVSEILKLSDELRSIRKIKYAASEEIKLMQNSPFIQIKKELIMIQFIPPKSPHNLLEEVLYHDPWALLAATIFLNKTSARQARPYVFWFLEENPDPLSVVGKKVEQLETYFGALGLQKKRAMQVWRMSHDFLYKEWTKVQELYGIGQYAEDAFRMFCLGDFSVQPKDRFLRIYKAWYEMQENGAQLK